MKPTNCAAFGIFILLFGSAITAPAQTALVEGNLVKIYPGDATPRTLDGTEFPPQLPNTNSQQLWTIRNVAVSGVLNVTTVTMTGPDAARFTPILGGNNINPGQQLFFSLFASKPAPGNLNATVNVHSNDPTFPIYAFSIHVPIVAEFDIPSTQVQPFADNGSATAKENPKTGLWDLKVKCRFTNLGPDKSPGGDAVLFLSNTPYVTLTSLSLGTYHYKKIKFDGSFDGGEKYFKTKIKGITNANTYQYLIVVNDNSPEQRDVWPYGNGAALHLELGS